MTMPPQETKFRRYHRNNPHVYDRFCKIADRAAARPRVPIRSQHAE